MEHLAAVQPQGESVDADCMVVRLVVEHIQGSAMESFGMKGAREVELLRKLASTFVSFARSSAVAISDQHVGGDAANCDISDSVDSICSDDSKGNAASISDASHHLMSIDQR